MGFGVWRLFLSFVVAVDVFNLSHLHVIGLERCVLIKWHSDSS